MLILGKFVICASHKQLIICYIDEANAFVHLLLFTFNIKETFLSPLIVKTMKMNAINLRNLSFQGCLLKQMKVKVNNSVTQTYT